MDSKTDVEVFQEAFLRMDPIARREMKKLREENEELKAKAYEQEQILTELILNGGA